MFVCLGMLQVRPVDFRYLPAVEDTQLEEKASVSLGERVCVALLILLSCFYCV